MYGIFRPRLLKCGYAGSIALPIPLDKTQKVMKIAELQDGKTWIPESLCREGLPSDQDHPFELSVSDK